MHIEERHVHLEYTISRAVGALQAEALDAMGPGEVPVRFIITRADSTGIDAEVGVLIGAVHPPGRTIFDYRPRESENTERFNAVLIIPTGIGCELGGHAGDANPVARLLAEGCDTLITHPNVVNASDVNELPENGLYVEGSVLTRLLMGTVGLAPVRANRILLVSDGTAPNEIRAIVHNAASTARVTLGSQVRVLETEHPFTMTAQTNGGRATGKIEHFDNLYETIDSELGIDAVAIASPIRLPAAVRDAYFASDGAMVNPWGGIEAMLTHAVSHLFELPAAHAPMDTSLEDLHTVMGRVDPRIAPEAVSCAYLHCVLKGLHRSPRIVKPSGLPGVITARDISCIVVPHDCIGLPVLAARSQDIPIIVVKNRSVVKADFEWSDLKLEEGGLFFVDNYLEAAGIMAALRSGTAVASVMRPLVWANP